MATSCDDNYVCYEGTVLSSCRIKIPDGKCDRFKTIKDYEEATNEARERRRKQQ